MTPTSAAAFEEFNSNVTVVVLYASTHNDNEFSLSHTLSLHGDEYIPPLHRIFRVGVPPFRSAIRPAASPSVVCMVAISRCSTTN